MFSFLYLLLYWLQNNFFFFPIQIHSNNNVLIKMVLLVKDSHC